MIEAAWIDRARGLRGDEAWFRNVYGAVTEAFRIRKYGMTLDEYAAFLNAVAATDPRELCFDDDMATDLQIAGIQWNGASGIPLRR